MRGWEGPDIEKLIAWMEDNRELLRGSTLHWTTKAKDALFEDSHIDAKKIKAKFHNMKNSWKAAKSILEGSSFFGRKEEECSSTMNYLLNRKCRFFWRLDGIFSEGINNVPTVTADTRSSTQQPTPLVTDGPDERPDSYTDQASLQENNDSSEDYEVLSTRPPGHICTSIRPSSSQPSHRISKRRPNKPLCGRENGSLDVRGFLGHRMDSWADRGNKRSLGQNDIQVQIARIQAESQERMLGRQMQMEREREEWRARTEKEREERQMQREREREERQMQMEREREERQMQMLQNVMATVAGMMKG